MHPLSVPSEVLVSNHEIVGLEFSLASSRYGVNKTATNDRSDSSCFHFIKVTRVTYY